jgi:hypothetical protein
MKILFALFLVLLPASAWAETTATAIANTSVYVTTTSASPIRVASAGTTFSVIEDQGEWVRVTFNDPQWGRRIGFVKRDSVKIADDALQPLDLSIAPATRHAEPQQQPVFTPRPSAPRPQFPSHIVPRSGVTFGTETAPLFGIEGSGDVLPMLQVYGSFDWHQNIAPKWFQEAIDLFNPSSIDIKSTVPSFVGMGGVKLMLPAAAVRPYALGGFGVAHGKAKVKVEGEDVTNELVLLGYLDEDDITWTKPIFEVGGGIAVPVGHLYIDVGYRFRKAIDAEDINMSGVYAGIGASF